ncbi:MAG: YHS domain-containing protein [Microscillaceae bacterium]|nr:YHS domain-containing protein [Microscillaceae bacterium]
MKNFLLFALLFLSLTHFSAMAQTAEIFSTKSGAIQGYDPVAYFKAGKALKGQAAYKTTWKGATWYFANAENLAAFKTQPEKYAPQYGGYCAYAVSQGYTAKIDPEAWKIVKGKLYLNYNAQVQKTWEGQQTDFIQKANQNWPKIINKQ